MDIGFDNQPYFNRIHKRIRFNITKLLAVLCVVLVIIIITIICLWFYNLLKFNKICPDGWIGYSGKCYYFSTNETNWYDSKKRCENMNSSLVVLNNSDIMKFISDYGRACYWIEKKTL
ncbi:SWPV1-007 [Shearwaterpox virus]|uniref:SWPV1-007 n=1 Tax=Shearwaterpox virus TaxID=1974596 RepID=A0A1V0S7M6_CNPV|nr:SWPV1-007 [Shearwaterpox virus]